MLFIDHESPAHCSSDQHTYTHTHRPLNIACKHINFKCFLIWFTCTRPNLANNTGSWRDKVDIQRHNLRHGLVYGLDAVAHGKLVHDVLLHLIEVNLPGIVSLRRWDFYHAASLHIRWVVEDVLQGKRWEDKQCSRKSITGRRSCEQCLCACFTSWRHVYCTW